MKIVKPQRGKAGELKLTADELRLLRAFRQMNEEAQRRVIEINERIAQRLPAQKKPLLRLVAGGAA